MLLCCCVVVLCVVCCCVLCVVVLCVSMLLCAVLCVCVCGGCVRGLSAPLRQTPLRPTPLRRTPLRRTPLRRTAQNFALFFPSPATVFHSFFPLFCLFRGILVVFEDRGMCTFWSSRAVVCEAPAARSGGVAGVSLDSPRAQTCTFEGPGLQKHHPKFNEQDQQEREKRMKNCGGRGKKKREILGPHRSGPPPFGAPHPSGPHPSGSRWVKHLNTKIGQSRSGPSWSLQNTVGKKMAKVGLAKVGLAKVSQHSIGQSRFGQSQSKL